MQLVNVLYICGITSVVTSRNLPISGSIKKIGTAKDNASNHRQKNAARINARLYDIKAEIDKALLEYDGQITADVIRSIMTGDEKGEVPLQPELTSNF